MVRLERKQSIESELNTMGSSLLTEREVPELILEQLDESNSSEEEKMWKVKKMMVSRTPIGRA